MNFEAILEPVPKWNTHEAIKLAAKIEQVAPKYGYHVALTGGLLYKYGPRKDADFVFYRIRQEKAPDRASLIEELASIGIHAVERRGWVNKAVYEGKIVDLFFPEDPTNEDEWGNDVYG